MTVRAQQLGFSVPSLCWLCDWGRVPHLSWFPALQHGRIVISSFQSWVMINWAKSYQKILWAESLSDLTYFLFILLNVWVCLLSFSSINPFFSLPRLVCDTSLTITCSFLRPYFLFTHYLELINSWISDRLFKTDICSDRLGLRAWCLCWEYYWMLEWWFCLYSILEWSALSKLCV